MRLEDLEIADVRPELSGERAELTRLLSGLRAEEWSAPTAAQGWDVKAIALHLLDDDLGWLSRGSDRDRSGQLDITGYRAFVDALAAKNQRWIDGARGLSPRILVDLLEWSGQQVDSYCASIDLAGEGHVVWANDLGVPAWFDIRDLTERWVHQMQIREAEHGVDAMGVDEQPWGRFVYFSDPEGNQWSLQELPDYS